jgi:phosphate transport system substrate-binding protein
MTSRSAAAACSAWSALCLLVACAKPAARTGAVTVDGSSTVFLISQAAADAYQPTGAVTVDASGTGGGFKKFCRGEIDVQGASRPITAEEAAACTAAGVELVELPIAYDGIAVVVNRLNTWTDFLTVAELRAMWAPDSKLATWKDVRPGFPDKPLYLFGPGADSGTYDYFTQAIVGTAHASRADYVGNEDDNVLVRGVAGNAGALGFFGYGYYTANTDTLRVVPIDDGIADDGAGPIAPSPATIADGTYQPLARPLFLYVSLAALARPEVARFVDYFVANAARLSAEVGYVPLPPRAMTLVAARLARRATGTVFGARAPIGVTIEQLMATETAAPVRN